MRDLDGNSLKLIDLLGRHEVVWLNFWGLRCAPCIQELPALDKIYREFATKGPMLIAIDTGGVDAEFIRKQIKPQDDMKPL